MHTVRLLDRTTLREKQSIVWGVEDVDKNDDGVSLIVGKDYRVATRDRGFCDRKGGCQDVEVWADCGAERAGVDSG